MKANEIVKALHECKSKGGMSSEELADKLDCDEATIYNNISKVNSGKKWIRAGIKIIRTGSKKRHSNTSRYRLVTDELAPTDIMTGLNKLGNRLINNVKRHKELGYVGLKTRPTQEAVDEFKEKVKTVNKELYAQYQDVTYGYDPANPVTIRKKRKKEEIVN